MTTRGSPHEQPHLPFRIQRHAWPSAWTALARCGAPFIVTSVIVPCDGTSGHVDLMTTTVGHAVIKSHGATPLPRGRPHDP